MAQAPASSAPPTASPSTNRLRATDEGYSEIKFEIPAFMHHWTSHQKAEFAIQLLLTLPSVHIEQATKRLRPMLQRDFLSFLPHELSTYILKLAGVQAVATCMAVSKKWHRIAQDNDVWRYLYMQSGWTINLAKVHAAMEQQAIAGSSSELQPLTWRYLYRERSRLERNWREGDFKRSVHDQLHQNNEAIYCLQFDSTKVVTGSRDHTVKVWDMATFECVRTMYGHTQSVLCLQYDNRHLITGSSDSRMIVWDMENGIRLQTLRHHSESVLNLRFDNKYLVSASKDRTLCIWDREKLEPIRQLLGHRSAVNAVQFVGDTIVSASGDRTLRVWDMQTGQCLRELIGHQRGIACLQFDGETIVSGSSDRMIRLWNVNTGECTGIISGHSDLVRTLGFDGKRLISGSYDESVKIWDLKDGSVQHDLRGAHKGRVFKLAFNDFRIVSASHDNRIVMWNVGHNVDTRYFDV